MQCFVDLADARHSIEAWRIRYNRDSWPGPNCDHAPEPCGRAVHFRRRPFRFPHRRRDLRSLRRKSVQETFRGVLVCQGVRKSSLPGKARGSSGCPMQIMVTSKPPCCFFQRKRYALQSLTFGLFRSPKPRDRAASLAPGSAQ